MPAGGRYVAGVTELVPGAYEHLVTRDLDARLAPLDPATVQRLALDPADAHEVLSRHIAALSRRALRAVPAGADRVARQVELANRLAAVIAAGQGDEVAPSHDLLAAVVERPAAPNVIAFPKRPQTPFSSAALLVNGRNQPRIGTEVNAEMASADHVDLLCAFIKWHGLRQIEQSVRALIERGGRLRVITTTYLGATDQRALDRLAELGAEIRISYETRTTRLHAKAWLFRRHTGAHTAYVGSSNLSKAALVDGVEWNVRLSGMEQGAVLETFTATFDEYWNDPGFEAYDPSTDRARLRHALAAESGTRPTDDDVTITGIDVRPYGYQQEILDGLAAEREVHGRHRNLVVMATGTGKTIVAALDYKRLRAAGTVETVLFLAHQEQILQQSRSTFRHVLNQGTFGETLVGGRRPTQWRHVFASVQSLSRQDLDALEAHTFDMVVVDEFHHAAAAGYTRLLDHLRPKILLGLTATPERSDGLDITGWFGGHTAVELRLWEALERQLLAPFQYFGIHDDVDLSALRFRRGAGYETAQLDNVYTGDHARARLILQAVRDKVDVGRMRALGFCVSVGHARFMADWFDRAGVPARAVTASTPPEDRQAARDQLERGELRALFTVDLYNEGVDIPAIDTVLLLRPTQSATIFLQQLGRGLRLADGKPCLTVLDFIGAQHAEFRFDLRYRALTGTSRRTVERAVQEDFPTLPAGCHIELDRVAKEIVLGNLRAGLRLSRRDVVAEVRSVGDVPLRAFLRETGLDPEDVYRRKGWRGWAGLRREAGLDTAPPGPLDDRLGVAFGRLLHVDDPLRIAALRRLIDGSPLEGRLAAVLHQALWGTQTPPAAARLDLHPGRRDELRQLLDVLEDRIGRVTRPLDPAGRLPLQVHARYSRDEACAAFGITDPSTVREGIKWVEAERADLFFVTLNKTEQHYSPSTMYQDRAISPELFQWESQSTTTAASPTGQRYAHHRSRGSSVHLFVRETKVADGDLGAPPYLYAGPMFYVQHQGERPMRVLWKLEYDLPADVFHAARVAAG